MFIFQVELSKDLQVLSPVTVTGVDVQLLPVSIIDVEALLLAVLCIIVSTSSCVMSTDRLLGCRWNSPMTFRCCCLSWCL